LYKEVLPVFSYFLVISFQKQDIWCYVERYTDLLSGAIKKPSLMSWVLRGLHRQKHLSLDLTVKLWQMSKRSITQLHKKKKKTTQLTSRFAVKSVCSADLQLPRNGSLVRSFHGWRQ